MIGPRAVFTTTAPRGSSDSSLNPSNPRVSRVSGVCTDNVSVWRSKSSSVTARSIPSPSSVPFGKYGS